MIEEQNERVGYAVLGLGVGRAHVDAAAQNPHARLAAICDIDPVRLAEVSAEYPEAKAYRSFDELIQDKSVDIISVCLPSGMHADYAVAALQAGKHVLVEKPLDITPARAMKIEEARQRTGRKVGCVVQNRNNACMRPLRDALDAGRLGRVFLGTFSVKWFREQSYYDNGGWRGTWEMDGGGSLMNQSIHTVDLMQWLMGEVESVSSAMGVYSHQIDTEDMTASLIRFQNGAAATLVSTTSAFPGIATEIGIYGTEGTVELRDDRLVTWKLADSDEEEEEALLEKYGRGNIPAEMQDTSIVTGHASQVNDIIDAVRFDREVQVGPAEAVKSVKIIQAVYESARRGVPVRLDQL